MAVAAPLGGGMKALATLFLAGALTLPGATFYVTVAGLGGEEDYEQRFASLAKEVDKLLKGSSAGSRVETLYGPAATKAKLAEILASIGKSATKQDNVVLLLIGHGTWDGQEYKFNLPGPDVSAIELATMLDRIPAQLLVVNTTSCSGGAMLALKKEGRAVITATKGGTEKNATVFPRYWAEALRDAASDVDKNEVVSALEAFRYANEKTNRFYETQKRIATEHAQIEDTGKSEPVRDPSAANGQGLFASRFALLRLGAAQMAANSPEKRKLIDTKEGIEQKIASLKYQRAAMPSEVYKKQLTDLLVQLAQTQAELDK
ncbi:MAG TPA: hypothetical protein VM120_13770 [Bryobacteraceae bacterium]|nr:hypothetical protein [Bryobacteraceae bacterium]